MTRLVATEQQVHRGVVEQLQWRGADGLFAFHVPNGGYRRPTEAALFKSLGVIGGVPDIMLVHQARAFGMELKRERTGRLSPAQSGGPGCLNSFSASISGASAGVRLPSGGAAG